MYKWIITLLLFVTTLCSEVMAEDCIDATGTKGGLVVQIGGDAKDLSEYWKEDGYVIQYLEESDKKVSSLKKEIAAAGCYGKVSVVQFDGKHLPYINNLVNLLVVSGKSKIDSKEIDRVLAPYGSSVVKGKKKTKPFPSNMDEWPQYLHGADNNCVAEDTVVGPPRHVQWISGPAWTRAHIGAATISAMVSSGGRLFTIEDRETAENPLLPAKWKLIARSAFNGIELWSMDYPDWEQITVYIKDYHTQMQRRLVALDDTVYCTPGLTAPLTALDAATGKILKEYKGTENTQEFVFNDGILYVMAGDRMQFKAYKGAAAKKAPSKKKKNKKETSEPEPKPSGPQLTFGGKGFPLSVYNPQTGNAENPVSVILAFDAKSGKELWRSEKIGKYTGCSMALKGSRLVYQSVEGVFCLDAKTGKENWAVKKTIQYGTGNRPNTVVLSDDAVYSEEGKNIFAYSLKDGSDYWEKPVPARKGYQASTDLLIVGNALWMCGNCNNAKGTVLTKPVSYDLKTGKEIKMIDQHLSKPMGHDRCFRNYITTRFFINSKTGGPDCMDLVTGKEYPAAFTRATCSMGPLPCNGLIYCGPWACQCHLPTGLHNFNAFYTNEDSLKTKGQEVKIKRSPSLIKGEAYGKISSPNTPAPWPTYRQDERRYSGIKETVPGKGLKRTWKTEFKNVLCPPVIADGKVFVAETDAYTLRALDAESGKELWQYIAGGRIDSPPTYYKGMLLMGSRDGWVHCLRASDGALSWRFKDLPDKLICAFDRVESAWPIHGSVLVKNDIAYFCGGRSSFLDGGIFIYGLEPATGKIRHQRQFYGPYAEDGFQAFIEEGDRSTTETIHGSTADVMSSEGDKVYVRRLAFNPDLTDTEPGKHLMASSGMLESKRQHREYKLVQENFNHRKKWTTLKDVYPTGDIIVSDGTDYFSVFGHPVNRGESWNPRDGYSLQAKTLSGDTWSSKWSVKMPMTGKAMALAGKTVFVIGAPIVFGPDNLAATYKGKLGAVMWAVAAADGSKIAEYKLDVLPAWDGVAAAYGKLFIVNQDGSIECWGSASH